MIYKKYHKVEDLLQDDSFIEWVIDSTSNQAWDEWQLLHPRNKSLATEARSLILGFKPKEEKVESQDVDHYLQELKVYLNISGVAPTKTGDIRLYNPNIKSYIGWAASVVLLLAVGALFIVSFFSNKDASVPSYQASIVEKEVPRGQKLTITLKDGSTVMLNSGSKIIYEKDFNSNRRLMLEGEAFFEVTKNPDKPFYIQCGDVTTVVLGTSFNIRAYPDEDIFQVVVASGKVRVNEEKRYGIEQILAPQQVFQLARTTGKFTTERAELDKYISWKNNVIYFGNADFIEIKSVLEKWYDVKFIYNSIPAIENFNGVFKNKSLEEVLEGINATTGLECRLDGKMVIINN